MKKLIYILSVLLLVTCGCLAVVLRHDFHLSDVAEVPSKEQTGEMESTVQACR